MWFSGANEWISAVPQSVRVLPQPPPSKPPATFPPPVHPPTTPSSHERDGLSDGSDVRHPHHGSAHAQRTSSPRRPRPVSTSAESRRLQRFPSRCPGRSYRPAAAAATVEWRTEPNATLRITVMIVSFEYILVFPFSEMVFLSF